MNKKLITIFLLAFALVSAFARAENNEVENEVEFETESIMHDIEAMDSGNGRELRLLQLEKHVTKNILYGEHVIEQIDALDINFSTAALADVVAQLKDVNEDIKDLLDGTLDDASTEKFVELKKSAINLTKEFRDLVKAGLTIAQRQMIRDAVDKSDFSEIENLNNQIRQAARDLNKEKVIALLTKMNVTDAGLLERIEAGNITVNELKDVLKGYYKELKKDHKERFEEKIKVQKEKLLELKNKALEKMHKITEKERARLKNIMSDASLSMSEKKARWNVLVEEKIDEKAREMKEKADVRTLELQQKLQDRNKKFQENIDERAEKLKERLREKTRINGSSNSDDLEESDDSRDDSDSDLNDSDVDNGNSGSNGGGQ
ncbi:MAG: hypothetical protein V1859_08355 [archaeon]